MRKAAALILIVLSLLFVTACTNDIKAPDDSWENIFLQYWDAMNTEYVHFDTDTDTDWDAIYDEYLPKFQALDYTKAEDSLKAFTYFKEMSINIDDYHFYLQVKDAFGSTLMLSPASEQKWWAEEQKNPDTELTIMSYPDVMWVDSTYGVNVLMSVDGKTTLTAANYSVIYDFLGAVEGTFEVSSLKTTGAFHNGSFKAEKGCTFTVTQPAEGARAQDMALYSVVNALGLKDFTYYYGVTDEDIFYFYISSFASTPNEPLLYKKDLTDAEKAQLSDEGYLQLHGIIWCIPGETDTLPADDPTYKYDLENYEVTDKDGNVTETINYIEKLKGVTDLFSALQSIGKSDKCTIDNVEYDISGVIMDVRSNGGGAVATLETILGSFFKDSTVFAKVRYKDGYSRYEYTPWVDFAIEEEFCNGVRDYDKPFAIIANGSSVSCSEISSSIVKNLFAKGALIGGQTFGGTCGLTDRTVYHSGPFTSNSLSVYTTTYETQLLQKDGSFEDLEGTGITPTKAVPVDETYATDARFDAAVKWVKEQL